MFEFPPEFQLSFFHWFLATVAAVVLGISKSGLKGISIIVVTIMALVFGGKASTGILLPMLCMADIMAVIFYRRHANWTLLFKLLPWMITGVLIGTWFGKDIPEAIFKRIMAGIIIGTVLLMFWWDRQKNPKIPNNLFFAGSMGLGAGIATMLGNLAGAFSNLFFLAMQVDKNTFIGTAAWLFFITNLFKIPFHIFSWETISADTFKINVVLLPAIALGFWIGTHIVAKIKENTYRKLILGLTFLGALLMFFK